MIGADAVARNWKDLTALHIAAAGGYREIARILLEHGALTRSTRCGKAKLGYGILIHRWAKHWTECPSRKARPCSAT